MKFSIAALLVGSAAAFAPAAQTSTSSALNLAVGETAPDFALTDQNGKTVNDRPSRSPLLRALPLILRLFTNLMPRLRPPILRKTKTDGTPPAPLSSVVGHGKYYEPVTHETYDSIMFGRK